MKLVIVESPAKAKTINRYLGDDYTVLASYGHVCDLPSKDGSVDPDANFAMKWQVSNGSEKRLSDITRALRSADRLILATDPDREGEAIAWHVAHAISRKDDDVRAPRRGQHPDVAHLARRRQAAHLVGDLRAHRPELRARSGRRRRQPRSGPTSCRRPCARAGRSASTPASQPTTSASRRTR